MRAHLFLFPFALVAICTLARTPAQSQELEESLNSLRTGLIGASVAIITLESDVDFADGTYKLKSSGAPDTDIDIFRISPEFSLLPKDSPYVPLLEVTASWLELESNVPTGFEPDDKISFDSWELGASLGLKVFLLERYFSFTPRMKVTYADIENSYEYRSEFSQEVLQPVFDSDIFNFDLHAWTYSPSLEFELEELPLFEDVQANFRTRFTYLYTDSSSAGGRIGSFHASTFVWKNVGQLDIPLGIEFQGLEFAFRPKVARTYLFGDADDALELGSYWEFGGYLLAGVLDESCFIKDFYVGASYAFGDDLQGWSIGLSGTLR